MNSVFELISKGYEIFIQFGLYVFVVIGFVLLFKKPCFAYYLTVFTIPFKCLYIWVGTNIEVWKLMSAMALCLYGPRVLINASHKLRKNADTAWLIFFISYTIFITLAFPFFIPEADRHVVQGGFFKNHGRMIYQIVFFLITINLILWPSYIFNNIQQVFYTFRIIVLSVITLSLLGLIQLFSLHTSGFDPFPIHRVYGFDNTGGMIVVNGVGGVQRLNSLAGEPKHFAIALILGLLILMIYRLNKMKIIRYDLPVMGMFLICLLATYSTTGYLWFGVILFFTILLYRQKFSGPLLLVILLAAMSLYVVNSETGGENRAYINKTINKSGLETQDEAVLGYFRDNPLEALSGLGLGNIHHYAVHYLPYDFPIFFDTPFKGNTGLLLLLGDTGFIGIFLLTLFIIKMIYKRSDKRNIQTIVRNKQNVLSHIIFISYTLFLMRYFELYYVFLGSSLYCSATTNKNLITHEAQ